MYYLILRSPDRVKSIIGADKDYFNVWDLFCRWVEDGYSENDFILYYHDPESLSCECELVDIRCPFELEDQV